MAGVDSAIVTSDAIAHILHDNQLQVPSYQREYAWKESHVLDLFIDIGRAMEEAKESYFLGAIVACATKRKAIEIVDGQQRLATVSILLAAMRDTLLDSDNESAINVEREYLLKKHGLRGNESPCMKLSDVDNDFFRKTILGRPGTDGRKVLPTAPSHRRIAAAYAAAMKHLDNITKGRLPADKLTILDKWLDFLNEKARVIFIKVADQADAFVIFETLNDRGLELSIADLTKNYLFGRANSRIAEAQQSWTQMTGILQASDSDATKYYIHHLWSSFNGVTRGRELFSEMRTKIRNEEKAVDFCKLLLDNARIYAALRNSDSEFWNRFGANSKRHVRVLSSQLRVAQIRMLLLAALDKFSDDDIKKVLQYSVFWSVRFLVAGGPTGNLESYYAQRAVEIREGKIKNSAELAKSMKVVAPKDEVFRTTFGELQSSDQLGRYYLRCLEKMQIGEANPHLGEDDETIGNLEHILPQSPDNKHWKISADDASRLKNRIGNLALMSPSGNSKKGNGSFSEAIKYYKESSFKLTQGIANYGNGKEWGEKEIAARQKDLSELAIRVWPLP